MLPMRVTMREVAAHANVSLKTVSRVVNGEPFIRPETQARVRAAIEELGWTPNLAARTLRTGRTSIVGIVVAELRRPLLASLVEALVTEVNRHGLNAAVEPTHGDPDRLAEVWAQRGRTFDALLVVDLPPEPAASDGDGGGPVVRLDVTSLAASAVGDQVRTDLDQAVALIERHLSVMGRAHAVQLGSGPLAGRPGVPLVELGEPGAGAGRGDRAAGYRAAQRALVGHPGTDAMVCGTDEIALGALAGLHAAGVAVPDDVAVIGFGALDDGWFSTPSLTTIDPDLRLLARTTVDLAARRLQGDSTASRQIAVPVTLVRRESTLGTGAR